MLHGKYFQNGSRTLVLVFQNAAKHLNNAIPQIYSGEINQNEVAEMHNHYTWIKFAERVIRADYLFVKDHFSSVYGWYFIDGGKMIYEQMNVELSNFIQKHDYERVIAFGSSKGGTGALIYGLTNPYVTNVFSLVPQIHVSSFINNLCPKEKSIFFGKDIYFEEQVNQFFYNPLLYTHKHTSKILFYTGIKDIQFKELIQYRDFLYAKGIANEMILNRTNERHTRLVNQFTPFIFSVLEGIIDNDIYTDNVYSVNISKDIRIIK